MPPGTRSGQRLRLKGKGSPSPKNSDRGDLYVIVQIVPPKDLDDDTRKLVEQLAEKAGGNPRDDLGWRL